MKEKSTYTKLYLGLFIIVLCLPYFFWILFGKFFDAANYENRNLETKPAFSLDTYGEFASHYEAYFDDNLPFKNALISLNSRLDYYLFHTSSSDRVIIGKEGWLFYADAADGDPMSDYQGKRIYSEEELQVITENLLGIEKELAAQGVEFVIFVAPNKERMYSEMMPEFYGEPADRYATLQIVDYIKNHTNIRIVYPYEELARAKVDLPETDIYYKTDTHWNDVGGYVGSRALLSELGIDVPDITNGNITIEKEPWAGGDLANILNMKRDFQDNSYSISGYEEHNMVNEKWDFSTEIIYHCQGADTRKLFVVRDSFFTAMTIYVASQFNDSYMIHRNVYTYENLIEQSPDIFVFEVVERYIEGLGSFSLY
ncbi:MAG: hypothetical protein NC434_01655 [Ruminococcus sp.]|nr:hypothetical protein [Ruminococcus sp.]